MSGILAVVGSVRDSRVESALVPLRYLGGEREQIWSEEDALVVVTRKDWQLDDDFCGDVLVLESPDLVVAADASLFDKKGLARKLSTAGVKSRGETASHYLEAAYRAWGPRLVEHLNGDYAFVDLGSAGAPPAGGAGSDRRAAALFRAHRWRPGGGVLVPRIGGTPGFDRRVESRESGRAGCRTGLVERCRHGLCRG